MSTLLGPDTEQFLQALTTPSAGLRVNTLRLQASQFEAISPFELRPLPFPPGAFSIEEEDRPGLHPYHAAGLYYLQDPGAMVVGALPGLEGEPHVLDLAAAPGGKATHLAARMGGRGLLVANDIHPTRARELAGNLERCGVRNAIVTVSSPARLAERWGARFDLVLVDAPCSGESMFHKSAAARREWSVESVAGCARRQGEILQEAVSLVRPGGLLLYSTCTFSPDENEAVLARLLVCEPELTIEALPHVPGGSPGRPDWADPPADPGISLALRLWPHRVPGAGHFVAALRRAAPAQSASRDSAHAEGVSPAAPTTEALELLGAFLHQFLPGLPELQGELVARGDEIYLLPSGSPPLGGISVLRPGWWLGTARKGRFEPSHALAMAIAPASAAAPLLFDADAPEVGAYLSGETIRVDGADGWVLICVDGYPLGWGKRSRGVVKNHYPKGLRRR